MKKYLPVIAVLSLIKLIIHLVGNRNYGFHRDELLHLSVSEHLASGYYEFPPFIAFVGKIALFVFGYSVPGVRFFATMAGIGILILCCLMAKELGGKVKAVFLAGICFLAFLPFYRNHCLFQPVAFDQFFWALGFYYLIRYFNTEKPKYLLLLGLAAGLGLMNKYTFLVWGFGVAVGLLFFQKGKSYRTKWIYLSGLIVLLISLPNFFWEWQHHFPLLTHMQKLKESQLDEIGPYDFALEQIKLPFTFIISLIGAVAFFFRSQLGKYRALGVATLVIFATMWILQSKAYYFFAIYPLLFASGAVMIERWFGRKPVWIYIIASILLLPLWYLPKAIPILPVKDYISYDHLKSDDQGRYRLPDDYADMFGWEEQVKLIDSVYHSLPESHRRQCMIWAGNYGEAGAIKILGKKYHLPDPVSVHGSFYSWGTGNTNRQICLSIGNEKESALQYFYEDIRLIKMIHHPYAIDEENNIPVYLCRKPKLDLAEKWPELEKYIFD